MFCNKYYLPKRGLLQSTCSHRCFKVNRSNATADLFCPVAMETPLVDCTAALLFVAVLAPLGRKIVVLPSLLLISLLPSNTAHKSLCTHTKICQKYISTVNDGEKYVQYILRTREQNAHTLCN